VKAGREPMVRIDIHTEFVMVAAQVLHERMSCADHLGRVELSQAAHRLQSGLESSEIGFDDYSYTAR
jgi:hypothetical protein